MALILILLFIVLPIAELYVIIQVGSAIGVLPTLGLLILDSILGAWLWRSQGSKAWERFNRALAEGRVPAREVFDGAMVILGGALLVTPGFITDIFGVILLIPPTRALVRGTMTGFAKRRVTFGFRVASPPPRSRPGGGTPSRARGYDYEGTAREVDETELPPGSGNAA